MSERHFFVILNLFQDPGAVSCSMSDVRMANERAWMLKQVQHDDCVVPKRQC